MAENFQKKGGSNNQRQGAPSCEAKICFSTDMMLLLYGNEFLIDLLKFLNLNIEKYQQNF